MFKLWNSIFSYEKDRKKYSEQERCPSDVLSYLTTDENLLQTEKSDDWEIYVTDKRVIFKKGGIFVAGIVIAILLSSVISFSLSMHFAVGPQGETGLQGPIG